MAKRVLITVALSLLSLVPGPAGATHDAELLATGEGTKGWVAIRFYTDGAANDPDPANGFLNEAGQIALEITYRAATTEGYLHAAPLGPLLNVDGSLNHFPVLIRANGWDGGEIGLQTHGLPDPANVSASFDARYGDNEWGGEGKTTYFHYPEEAGEYIALMYVAGDVVRWRWRLFARPHNNVRVVGIERGEGGTYLFDGHDFAGTAVAVDAGEYTPSIRSANTASIDAEHRLLGMTLGSTGQTLEVSAPNGSFDCSSACWFSRQFPAGRTTFTLDGTTMQDRELPFIAFADVKLP